MLLLNKAKTPLKAVSQLGILNEFLLLASLQVTRELRVYSRLAGKCPDPQLREMALSSIKHKKFHCQGGSIFAAWARKPYRQQVAKAIVALQTISDYLDNLCDRTGIEDEEGFRQLHRAFVDALSPEVRPADYYSLFPYQEDGNYLAFLVNSCQKALLSLPLYPQVREPARQLAGYYCTLQVCKHLHPAVREKRLVTWLKHLQPSNQLFWWELAAATGSTLGIFALFALASKSSLTAEEIEQITGAYFPWIQSLHILLDYFIDQEEDRQGGDLNFVFYYADEQIISMRLKYLLEQALSKARNLPAPFFHETVVAGLLAMYLSDPKVMSQNLHPVIPSLLKTAGPQCRHLYFFCRALRRIGMV